MKWETCGYKIQKEEMKLDNILNVNIISAVIYNDLDLRPWGRLSL
jgi:hypothetical protein